MELEREIVFVFVCVCVVDVLYFDRGVDRGPVKFSRRWNNQNLELPACLWAVSWVLVGSGDQTQRPIVFTDLLFSERSYDYGRNLEHLVVEVFSKRLFLDLSSRPSGLMFAWPDTSSLIAASNGPSSFLSVEKKARGEGIGACIGRALALCSFLRLFLYVALRGFSHLVSLSQVKLFANGFHICLCPPLPKPLFLTSLRFKARFCWLCAKECPLRKIF